MVWCLWCIDFELFPCVIDLCGKHSQAECAAEAAHLPIDYAGVPR